MTEESQSQLKKLAADATPEQIKEAMLHNEKVLKEMLAGIERSKHKFVWVDRALYVIVGILSVVLIFRVGNALLLGRWDSLGANDFRLSLAWLFGTLFALWNRIREQKQQ